MAPANSALLSRRAGAAAALALLAGAGAWLWYSAGRAPNDALGRQFFGLWRTRHIAVAAAMVWCAAALFLSSASRPALLRFLVANASVVAMWIVLELVGLAGLVSYESWLGAGTADQLGTRPVPLIDVSGFAREDLAVAWNLARPRIPFRFRTDSFGFRNEPTRDGADVYCLGDSFLVAGLVPHEDTLAAQLEQRLARPVMNVALVGLSPQAEEQLLFSSNLPLDGRLVLHFIFEGNDLLDSAAWRGTRKPETQRWPERTLLHQLVLRAQILTQPQPAYVDRRTGWIGHEAYRFGWLRPSFEGLEGELEPIADTLADTRRRVLEAGGSYAVVLIPDKIRVLGPLCRYARESEVADWTRHLGPLPNFLAEWAKRSGVDYIDLTAALSNSAQRGDVPWFPADTHWNEIGHHVAAEAIAAWLPSRRQAGANAVSTTR